MNKFLVVMLILLSFSNLSFAKNIQLGSEIILDVPDSHEFILIEEDASTEGLLYGTGELFENLEELDIKFSVVGPTKLIEVIQSLVDGTEAQDIDVFKQLLKEAEKREYYDFDDPKEVKRFGKEMKKIMKKEKIGFYTYVIFPNNKIDKSDDVEFRELIHLHRNRSNSELAKITCELSESNIEVTYENLKEGEFSSLVKGKKRNEDELGIMLLNIEKSKKLLNWSPEISLIEGLKKEYDWASQHLYRWEKVLSTKW